MVVGNLGEGVSCLTPLLGHLEHVSSSAKHLQGIISLARPSDMQDKVREAVQTKPARAFMMQHFIKDLLRFFLLT